MCVYVSMQATERERERERETKRKQEAEESRQYKAPLVGAQVTRLQPSTNTQQLEEED